MDVFLSNHYFICYYYIIKENGCKEKIEHMYDKKKGQPYYTNRHSCFLLQYHMVLVTKYRHPVLTGGVKDLVYQTIRDTFEEKGSAKSSLSSAPPAADRVIFIDDGGIVEEETPEAFFEHPSTERAQRFLNTFTYEKIQKQNP